MEEGERLGGDVGEDKEDKEEADGAISGFATCLAASLLKETMKEKEEEAAVWAIPCSSDCHSHGARPPEEGGGGGGGREGGKEGGTGGRLCWTPESHGSQEGVVVTEVGEQGTCSGHSLEEVEEEEVNCQNKVVGGKRASHSDTEDEVVRLEEGLLRKGTSEPAVWGEEGEPRERRRRGRRNLLSYLGLRKDDGEEGGGRGKSLRKTLSGMFHLRRKRAGQQGAEEVEKQKMLGGSSIFRLPGRRKPQAVPPGQRALPPTPPTESLHQPASPLHPGEARSPRLDGGASDSGRSEEHSPRLQGAVDGEELAGAGNMMDFAASIEKVKDHGWYWGPLSGEAAERILAPEPDGSFVVRDSSDHHYIFSLTFKLNGFVRHVRIEHDQGNFSFGSFTKFKSNTIVEFIENAVEHSRSGRYLFFLHRRPVLGPMRVQLLHPVSRFKRVQSLQHLCRYIIVKHVRKDLLDLLPVPGRIKTYLNTPFYYSEQVTEEGEEQQRCPTLEQIEENVQNWGQQADPDVEEGHLEQLDEQVGDDGEHLGSDETEERPALGSYPS